MSTSTETIPVPTTKPTRSTRKERTRLYGGAAIVGLVAGLGIGALTDHRDPAPDAATVQHTVTLDDGTGVVLHAGDPLPTQVVTALRDPHQAFEVGLKLERATGSHVLLVQAHGTGFVGLDPLASGTGVVVNDTPVAELALQEATDYTVSHTVAPDGFPWQVVDLTK